MSFLMILRIAIKALSRNKMRTALTMLGMIIGVAAVITMVALGTGAQSSIESQIQSAGTNMIIVSAGNFYQTDDQLNFGDHTEKFAYYASLNGNRSNYGLAPPVAQTLHDATNGYGGFASFIYNRTPKDQFRLITQLRNDFFQIPYDPDPNSPGNQQFDSSGLRDGQHETDAIAAFSWLLISFQPA